MRRAALIAAAWASLPVGAACADVVSERPDAVAVTIYRDGSLSTVDLMALGDDDESGLAMITETRTVDLPAGRTKIRFEGVADGIMPQSAAVEGLPGKVAERNFDFDLLSPGALIARAVGTTVTLVRTNPKTGQETRETATLRSGPNGVVLDFGGRVEALKCGGEPERLVFDKAPEGLADRPTLSALADIKTAGRYTVKVSYLTVRMNWNADYVARVAPDGKSLALTGWITLANRSRVTFADAPTQVVAGRLAREAVDLPEITLATQLPACWPLGTTHDRWALAPPPPPPPPPPPVPVAVSAFARLEDRAAVYEVVVTANKIESSNLGDYKLYTLPNRTTVAARQTKQVQFLDQPEVKFDTVYVYRLTTYFHGPASDTGAATTTLRFTNKTAFGLGKPLPAGNVAVRQAQAVAGGREVFVGENRIRDVAVGEPAELEIGEASDVQVSWRLTSDADFKRAGRQGHRRRFEATVTNAKADAVAAEVRYSVPGEGFRIIAEDHRHGTKGGDPVWRVNIPAQGAEQITFSAEYLD